MDADFMRYIPEPQYPMVAYFVIYYTRTTISHGCRFLEILHQNHKQKLIQETLAQGEKRHFLGFFQMGIPLVEKNIASDTTDP